MTTRDAWVHPWSARIGSNCGRAVRGQGGRSTGGRVCDGGIRRGTHVLKALAAGAKACSGGRMYFYALAAAGQPGVEKALGNMRTEIERDMKLMGVTKVSDLCRENLR